MYIFANLQFAKVPDIPRSLVYTQYFLKSHGLCSVDVFFVLGSPQASRATALEWRAAFDHFSVAQLLVADGTGQLQKLQLLQLLLQLQLQCECCYINATNAGVMRLHGLVVCVVVVCVGRRGGRGGADASRRRARRMEAHGHRGAAAGDAAAFE